MDTFSSLYAYPLVTILLLCSVDLAHHLLRTAAPPVGKYLPGMSLQNEIPSREKNTFPEAEQCDSIASDSQHAENVCSCLAGVADYSEEKSWD